MNQDNAITLVVAIVITFFALFFLLREINNWYWRINERTSAAHKTNFLLERISMQLGASVTDEVIIEEIATGQQKSLKIDEWVELKMKNKKWAKKYRVVKKEVDK
jgi:hypothetical protein